MILFISSFPALSNEKDGVVQRIASIDSLINDVPRTYLHISFRRHLIRRIYNINQATVIQLNLFLHFFLIILYFKRAKIVYIHSIYNSLKALPAYWMCKTVTDIHGAVPEEEFHQGNTVLSYIYNHIESMVLCRSTAVVYVTEAMKQHFYKKHGRQSAFDYIVPILPKFSSTLGNRSNVLNVLRNNKTIIYAGGIQSWQNVPLMLASAVKNFGYQYIFLSGETKTFERFATIHGLANCKIASVEPDQVAHYYLRSTFGFILRDSILVNKIACPTKLIEYLYWGVIPVVLSPDIGDFYKLGFSFITLDEFDNGNVPADDKIKQMRIINRQVVDKMIKLSEDEILKLQQIFYELTTDWRHSTSHKQ